MYVVPDQTSTARRRDAGTSGAQPVESGLDVKQGGGMSWSYDAGSPQRDTSASVEDDAAALFGEPTTIAWRDKLVRLWRLLTLR